MHASLPACSVWQLRCWGRACRWAAVAEEDWPEEQEQRNVILADWDPNSGFGDRRQEIVFIGVNMNQDKITEQVGVRRR